MRTLKRLLLACLALLTGCDNSPKEDVWGEPFLRGVNVKSGDYYLVVYDEYSGGDGLLFDDPAILHQYKDGIRVKKSQAKSFFFGEGGGGQLSLWRKGKDDEFPVRRNQRTENWQIPADMAAHGKVIARQETYTRRDDFFQRLFALRAIDGVAVSFHYRATQYAVSYRPGMEYRELKANPKDPCVAHASSPDGPAHLACEKSFMLFSPAAEVATDAAAEPVNPPQTVISMVFPAVMTRAGEPYDVGPTLQALRQRVTDILARQRIDGYYVVAKAYVFTDNPNFVRDPSGTMLHSRYSLPDGALTFPDYNAHAYGLRIFCPTPCYEPLAADLTLDWLDSPVPHDAFLTDLRAFLHRHDKTLDPTQVLSTSNYRATSIFGNTMEHEPQQEESAVLWSEGWLRHTDIPAVTAPDKESWHINWGYDLDLALRGPYPAGLLDKQREQ